MLRSVRPLNLLSRIHKRGLRILSGRPPLQVYHLVPFEEERVPHYNQDEFYSVDNGDVFENKYKDKVIGKLGYGAYATVWLCRNLQYVSLSSSIQFLLIVCGKAMPPTKQ